MGAAMKVLLPLVLLALGAFATSGTYSGGSTVFDENHNLNTPEESLNLLDNDVQCDVACPTDQIVPAVHPHYDLYAESDGAAHTNTTVGKNHNAPFLECCTATEWEGFQECLETPDKKANDCITSVYNPSRAGTGTVTGGWSHRSFFEVEGFVKSFKVAGANCQGRIAKIDASFQVSRRWFQTCVYGIKIAPLMDGNFYGRGVIVGAMTQNVPAGYKPAQVGLSASIFLPAGDTYTDYDGKKWCRVMTYQASVVSTCSIDRISTSSGTITQTRYSLEDLVRGEDGHHYTPDGVRVVKPNSELLKVKSHAPPGVRDYVEYHPESEWDLRNHFTTCTPGPNGTEECTTTAAYTPYILCFRVKVEQDCTGCTYEWQTLCMEWYTSVAYDANYASALVQEDLLPSSGMKKHTYTMPEGSSAEVSVIDAVASIIPGVQW